MKITLPDDRDPLMTEAHQRIHTSGEMSKLHSKIKTILANCGIAERSFSVRIEIEGESENAMPIAGRIVEALRSTKP